MKQSLYCYLDFCADHLEMIISLCYLSHHPDITKIGNYDLKMLKVYWMRKEKQSKQSYILQSDQHFSIEMKTNSPIMTSFVPRKMGNLWLNGKGRRNNQTPMFVWLVLAHLLLLPSVKVSYADGVEPAIVVVVVSRELVAAAQLQLTDYRVAILPSCCSPGRPLVVLICAIPGGRIGEGEGKHLALIRWIQPTSSISILSMRPYSSMRARSVHFSFSSLSSLSMKTPGLTKYNWWLDSSLEKNILMNDWSTIIIIIIYTANKWFAPSSLSPTSQCNQFRFVLTNIFIFSIITHSTNHIHIIIIKLNPTKNNQTSSPLSSSKPV